MMLTLFVPVLTYTIASIALLICVLIGCSSPSAKNFALLRMPPGETLASPEFYIGLSGICVVSNINDVSCSGHFPYQFNQKISNVVSTNTNRYVVIFDIISSHAYINPVTKTEDEPVPQLAITLGSLLIFSICLSTMSIAVSLSQESGFSKHVIVTAVPDLLVMICCAVIVAMVVYGYPGTGTAPQFHIGACLMYSAFGARIMSHPMVTKTFIRLCSTCLRPTNNLSLPQNPIQG
jgi:hypothetical protein